MHACLYGQARPAVDSARFYARAICRTQPWSASRVMLRPRSHSRRACVQVLRFRAQAFTGGHKMSSQSSSLKEGVDLAVCTSGRLQQLLDAGHLELSACKVPPQLPENNASSCLLSPSLASHACMVPATHAFSCCC